MMLTAYCAIYILGLPIISSRRTVEALRGERVNERRSDREESGEWDEGQENQITMRSLALISWCIKLSKVLFFVHLSLLMMDTHHLFRHRHSSIASSLFSYATLDHRSVLISSTATRYG